MMHESDELTYVVLDVPDPQASSVMAIRKAHADLVRAALAVEITLTESFDPAQSPGQAFTALDDIAQEVPSIEASFAGAHRFPNSDTFVMRLADEAPFHALHRKIASAGLTFLPSSYPFVPHCTLRTRSPVTPEDAAELLATEIPGTMLLDTLSVYTLSRAPTPAGLRCVLRHRTQLRGSAHRTGT